MPLVAGVDSSTQSCKVAVYDADTGGLLREGRATHPSGEVDPQRWLDAFAAAARAAGGLDDVAAVAVGGQQHGMVALDADGRVVRPALLWDDLRSAPAAAALVAELGGPAAWAEAVGSVPVASFTVTKLRWLAEHEPGAAARTAAVCLPHDWLTWQLAGAPGLDALTTDRGDASGTGYWSPATGAYRRDLLVRALGHDVVLPRVLGPAEAAGQATAHAPGAILGPGTGDNMAAALGLQTGVGDVVISLGTSGVAAATAPAATADATGTVAGFADATGRFLPLVCTVNAARVLDTTARLLGVGRDAFDALALSAPSGAGGLVLVPWLDGERTPDRPTAAGSLHGITHATADPAFLARAAVEGMLCGVAGALDGLLALGVPVDRLVLVGGGARSAAVRALAPAILGRPVLVPPPGEPVATGAARQAAWVLAGTAEPPAWPQPGTQRYVADPVPGVRERYAEATAHVLDR